MVPVTPTLTTNNTAATVMTNDVVVLTCHTDTLSQATLVYTFYNNDTVITSVAGDTVTVTNAQQALLNSYSCTASVKTAVSSRSPVITQSTVGKCHKPLTFRVLTIGHTYSLPGILFKTLKIYVKHQKTKVTRSIAFICIKISA